MLSDHEGFILSNEMPLTEMLTEDTIEEKI